MAGFEFIVALGLKASLPSTAGLLVHAGNVPVIYNGIVGEIRLEWFHPVLVSPHVCSQ